MSREHHKNFYIIFVILYLIPVILMSNNAYADVIFSPVVRIDDDPDDHPQIGLTIKVDKNGILYIVFSDYRYHFPYGDISFSSYTNGGDNWSENVKITDSCFHHARFCNMDIDTSGNIYVVWYEEVGTYELLFTKSEDGGESWLMPNVRVNDDAAYYPEAPKIAVGEDGTIYVAWIDEREGNFHFKPYFTKSTDGGETWLQPNIRVDDPPTYCSDLDIAVDRDGVIYVAWVDWGSDLRCSRSIDGGFSWSQSVRVNNDDINVVGGNSLLAGEGGSVYLTWYGRHRDWAIWFAKSDDYGETWIPPVMVNSDTTCEYDWPSLAMDETGRLHIVYRVAPDQGQPFHNLYYTFSTNDGLSWAESVPVMDSGPHYQAWFPKIVAKGNNVFIAWDGKIYEEARYSDIWFSRGEIIEGIEEDEEPLTSQILVFPNPFSSKVRFRYISKECGSIYLRIYDLQGRLVREIHKGENTGTHLIEWDGRNQSGIDLPTGLYFYSLYVDEEKLKGKLIILRR